MHKGVFFFLVFFFPFILKAQNSTARIMFYNLLDFPEAPPSNRTSILQDIILQTRPDVFMVAELQSQEGAELILNQSLDTGGEITYMTAPFVANSSNSSVGLQQLLYYNSAKFNLMQTDVIQTSLRDINHYQLKAKTEQDQENPILINFFVAHFKASQGINNEQVRFEMAADFTNYINNNLSTNDNVVFAGDFNFYSANESGFQQLFIGNTIIPMKDPIQQVGDWHTNSNYSAVHTQSTRESSSNFNGFGAGGGLDDRFDFIFLSENMLNQNHEIHYVDNTYLTYGNNSNCYNEDINDTLCIGQYSQQTRDLLWSMSDHLPIILDVQLNQDFLKTTNLVREDVITLPYGNMISNELIIRVDINRLESTPNIRLYSLFGRKVKEQSLNDRYLTIDVSDLPSGIYVLKSSIGNALKIIILH